RLGGRQVRRYTRAGCRVAADQALLGAQARPRGSGPGERGARPSRKRALKGRLTLAFLDEVGFSPSQPTSYSWVLPGQRKLIPYESPEGRRVNAFGVLIPHGPLRWLRWDAVPRTLRSE